MVMLAWWGAGQMSLTWRVKLRSRQRAVRRSEDISSGERAVGFEIGSRLGLIHVAGVDAG